MSTGLANFLFEAANFLLLAAALGWVLFAPVRRALDAERERRAAEVGAAEKKGAEAEALMRRAEEARAAADRETTKRRDEVLEGARAEASATLEKARTSAARERRTLERELAIAREAQAARLAEQVGRIAAESVRRLMEQLEGPPLDAALARAAAAQIEALPAAERGRALVESARPLEPETRRLLEAALGAHDERVVAELGAGVRVTTEAGQIDATALAVARRAAAAARDAAAPPDPGGDGG